VLLILPWAVSKCIVGGRKTAKTLVADTSQAEWRENALEFARYEQCYFEAGRGVLKSRSSISKDSLVGRGWRDKISSQ
jgi:hypothetical protein